MQARYDLGSNHTLFEVDSKQKLEKSWNLPSMYGPYFLFIYFGELLCISVQICWFCIVMAFLLKVPLRNLSIICHFDKMFTFYIRNGFSEIFFINYKGFCHCLINNKDWYLMQISWKCLKRRKNNDFWNLLYPATSNNILIKEYELSKNKNKILH